MRVVSLLGGRAQGQATHLSFSQDDYCGRDGAGATIQSHLAPTRCLQPRCPSRAETGSGFEGLKVAQWLLKKCIVG